MELIGLDQYHKPTVCTQCGGSMVFKGVGEYRCEKCQALEYDDYGKVRLYIEEHKGVTAAQIEAATGVKQRTIRQMLKEERLEVTKDSKAFLQCEKCGISIRSGRFCPACEAAYNKHMGDKKKEERVKLMKGHGLDTNKGEDGEKRFRSERYRK